jgi:GNAT superfamily N-acetyltransferase
MIEISTDPARLDVPLIHRFLAQESAWAKNIPIATVQRSIQHSLCFGGYLNGLNGVQIAFARVVSDYATFAYLMDVFVLPDQRGNGYSKVLLEAVYAHPQLQDLRRFVLASSTARGLYQQFGFTQLGKPEVFMEINRPDLYQAAQPPTAGVSLTS